MTWGPNYATEQTLLAKTIAYVAHRQQQRAGLPPEPYFEHVRRVAAVFPVGPERCVGYLHDVVEDTPLDAADLVTLGVDGEVVRAVGLLTHLHQISHDEYVSYVQRIFNASAFTDAGRWARRVKLADLADNYGAVGRLRAADKHQLAAALGRRYRAAELILRGPE